MGAMTGTEPTAEFPLWIGRLLAQRNTTQMGADPDHDQPLGFFDPVLVGLGVDQVFQGDGFSGLGVLGGESFFR